MHIIIIGAGIGGLSAGLALAQSGHDVTIFESTSALADVGAGVQIAPNATRWFWKWGLGSDLLNHSSLPERFCIRHGEDGRVLRSVDFEQFPKVYGAPYLVIHRADIHHTLYEHAVRAGVKIVLNNRAVEYGFEDGTVTFNDGTVRQADLIVAMDGINSRARQAFVPETGRGLERTGWAAYRVMVSVEKLERDPRTADLVAQHVCNCWVGDQKLIMAYMVKGSEWLNVVHSHRDDVNTADWTSIRYQEELKNEYGDWSPEISAILEHASTNIQNWPVEQSLTLTKWTSESGKFVLAGDASHSMAFYLSMGVSMAVEDAAALCECLRLHEKEGLSLKKAMKLFEYVRKERAENVRDASLHAGSVLQMKPGVLREQRDEALRTDGKSSLASQCQNFLFRNSYGIADEMIRDWCYGYNVIKALQVATDEPRKEEEV
jgi:salicylate hydroxylase